MIQVSLSSLTQIWGGKILKRDSADETDRSSEGCDGVDPGDFADTQRAKKPEKIPTVMTKKEVREVVAAMSGTYQLMSKLLYGCGLRLMECVRLRYRNCLATRTFRPR